MPKEGTFATLWRSEGTEQSRATDLDSPTSETGLHKLVLGETLCFLMES